ncbi:isochorismate synthase [Flavobacteriaceae bacterium]|nr:isochorismate synthase [Flavobacteriaceae bacterium]
MIKALKALEEKKLPFVVFKHPNSNELELYFQEDDRLYLTQDFSEQGFLMAPFNVTNSYPFIPNKNHKKFDLSFYKESNSSDISFGNENREAFITLVEKALVEFSESVTEKIVLSRSIPVSISDSEPINTFVNLANLYPTAFVYYWHHPKTGSWMGATPERFASLSNNELHTISLAGTSIAKEDEKPIWSEKELQEQQLVTVSIEDSLRSIYPNSKIEIGSVQTVQAGSIYHLKTDIRLKSDDLSLFKIAKALHPTPAVGGVPKKNSLEFILKNEGHNRKYYTGFLGPFDSDHHASLYVNLRCAELIPSGYRVYVGAGITTKSIPLNEWEETKRKAKTFCKAL